MFHFSGLCYRCCDGAIQDVPRVLVCANGFLGDLRRSLATKLPRAEGFAMNRLTVTVSHWMGNSFLTFVDVLESLSKREVNPSLREYEIDAMSHKWKEQNSKGDQCSSWCFSNMIVVGKNAICLKR